MTRPLVVRRKAPGFPLTALLGALLLVPGFLLVFLHMQQALGMQNWADAMFAPDRTNIPQVLFHFSFLPRITVALLSGAALGLAGAIMQQVLQNPLAEPTTLGTASGAHLALILALLFLPENDGARPWIAFAGGISATGLVFLLGMRGGSSQVTVILTGLVVTLLCGAIGSVLTLFNDRVLQSVFMWGAGSLNQTGWDGVSFLVPRIAIAAALSAIIIRPLALSGLARENARALGLSVEQLRIFALIIAVFLASSVISIAGVIGFVGLAAPALARLAGARRISSRLIWAPVFGAGLLLLTDQLLSLVAGAGPSLPTGTATALLGAPLLIVLLRRMKATPPSREAPRENLAVISLPPWFAGLAVLLLASIAVLSLSLGQGPAGLHFSLGEEFTSLLPWRGPRMLAALCAGASMAAAGAIIQRLTANPMASPEVLGISSGAGLAVILLGLSVTAPEKWMQIGAAAAGAAVALGAVLAASAHGKLQPASLLLAGVALGTVFSTFVTFTLTIADPRLLSLLTWLAGSTYGVTAGQAAATVLLLAATLPTALLANRWLDIHPLGEDTARSLGIGIGRSRLLLLLLAAFMVAGAMLVVGPLSFVGLIGPHIARMAGCRRAVEHLAGSALAGALIMVTADWLGRTVLFPYQVPAGLLASLIGAPLLLFLLRNRTS